MLLAQIKTFMGILDIFNRKRKIVDELFGVLTYKKLNNSLKNFYEGEVTFDYQKIGVKLEADINGPTKKQKDFYITLRDSYPTIKKDIIIPFLKRELEQWGKNGIIDFDKEYCLDAISISRITDKPVEWTLTLYSFKIQNYLTLKFVGINPQEGVIISL
jgi:hypothetical protein